MPLVNGGTGLSSTPTNGQILIGNGTSYVLSTITAGTNISITNGIGTITIANTNTASVSSVSLSMPSIFTVTNSPVTTTGTLTVTSNTQSANTIYSGPTTGIAAIPTFRTLVAADIPSISLTTGVSGILPIVNGGTALSTTPTNGKLLIGNGTGYTLANLTQGNYAVITNGSGAITIGIQDASVSVGGAVNTTGQTFTGIKTMQSPFLLNTVFGTDVSSSLSIQPDGRVVDNGGFSFNFPVNAITANFPLTAPNLSGTNTGNVSFAIAGASPNTSGASLSGQTITLQPADGSNPGLITAGTQSIAGSKTFLSPISGSLLGNATTATSTTNFSGNLLGDVTGTQASTVVSLVGGQSAVNVASGSVLANAATNLNTASTIVKRDASGNFTAGTITATLIGNATSTTNFSGSLVGDVTGTQGATVVSLVGGQSATNVAAATVLANAATNLNTASTIVKRDASGNFTAGTITANLTGTVTGSSSLNVLKAGDTMTGVLILPAGTAAAPTIKFTGSTNTGLSAATANTLSLDTNGVERLSISTALIKLQLPTCDQALQSFTVTAGGQSVAANATTSVLLLQAGSSFSGLTITFPASPTNGQYFTIILGSTNSINTITNVAGTGGAAIVNASLQFTNTPGQTSANYFYFASSNAWYRT